MRKKWLDGNSATDVASQLIRPGKNLTSFQRLEVYNQQYWYRLLDCLEDDFPGLRALLGQRRFARLAREYIVSHPSKTFSLRDLGQELVSFLQRRSDLIEPNPPLCVEMAMFEWAKIVAFDGPASAAIDADYIRTNAAGELKIGLQPYLTLLDLHYALDRYSIALADRQKDRNEAGSDRKKEKRTAKRAPYPVREEICLVVHRHENVVYFKRVERAAFVILTALRRGRSLNDAVSDALTFAGTRQSSPVLEEDGMNYRQLQGNVQNWFTLWMQLGWLCRRD